MTWITVNAAESEPLLYRIKRVVRGMQAIALNCRYLNQDLMPRPKAKQFFLSTKYVPAPGAAFSDRLETDNLQKDKRLLRMTHTDYRPSSIDFYSGLTPIRLRRSIGDDIARCPGPSYRL